MLLSITFASGTQCEQDFWWNMGLNLIISTSDQFSYCEDSGCKHNELMLSVLTNSSELDSSQMFLIT